MPGIIIAPNLDTVLVQRQGIFTLPAEDAIVGCNCQFKKPCGGVDIDKLPFEVVAFFHTAKAMGSRFIERQVARGFEYVGPMVLHGPFPSYDLNRNLADLESSRLKEAMRRDHDGFEHPEMSLEFVFERDEIGNYADYVFVGDFLFKDQMTDVEVPSGQHP